tara:strand:+ start:525 stop:767 length:243 start_codon:yes stop_codon:yes gene_type:complete
MGTSSDTWLSQSAATPIQTMDSKHWMKKHPNLLMDYQPTRSEEVHKKPAWNPYWLNKNSQRILGRDKLQFIFLLDLKFAV